MFVITFPPIKGLDEDLMQNLAMKLHADWRRLAEWLNLRPCDIKKLEEDYPNPDKRTYMVLVTWRKRQHATCDLLGELTKVLIQHNYKEIANGLVDGKLFLGHQVGMNKDCLL